MTHIKKQLTKSLIVSHNKFQIKPKLCCKAHNDKKSLPLFPLEKKPSIITRGLVIPTYHVFVQLG